MAKNTTAIDKKKKKIGKIEDDINKITQSIISVETDKMIGNRSEEEANGIVKNLEKHRLGLHAQIEELKEEVASKEQKRKWIDWVKEFGNRIEAKKNPDLPTEEKKRFLEGVVERVTLTNISKQEHTLDIEFRLPYVNDKFKWHADRRDGYTITDGDKHLNLSTNLLKKTRD